MITIYGNADSVNVQKVLWCCEEAEIAYRRIDAGRHFGVVDTAEFRRLNPNGLVPTIEDAGYVVWESNAIVRYLAAKYSSGQLWPHEARQRADADRWMDWANSTLWPSLLPLFRAYMRTPHDQRDYGRIEQHVIQAQSTMSILDGHLAGQPYVGGSVFSMGDIAVGCAAWRWFALPIARAPLANLERWFQRLAERPAFRKIVMVPLIT
ncbi:glutathione S-transferase family protein [Noviherbaspirillum galbum]|uniref:Glutathione S-transferase family protein n=1 Tax=Noviherbaspirillum galbum TaxID=2709383 RepID=A0A6B3SZI5_9BURK|nr:glutathione S-transferase family protein [Noviherbaspirillum galbum]NEX64742.1 glutathione S-transferase family protein [Noviherbaspirillum galbum]